MHITYDPRADALAIILRGGELDHANEVEPGVILHYEVSGDLAQIELLDASRRVSGAPLDIHLELLAPELAPLRR